MKIKNCKLKIVLVTLLFFLWSNEASAFTISKPSLNNTGLVGWWTFDGKNITNGRADDVSGSGNHGNLVNIATSTFYTAGKIGQGFNFDGSDDYVDSGNSASLQMGSNNFSVSLWVYGTSAADTSAQHGGFSTGGKRWQFQQSAVSDTKFVFAIDDDTTAKTVAGDKLAGNYWTHMVGVRDGNNLRLYEDGVQVSASPTDITGYGSITSTRNFLIGAGQAESDGVKSQFWDGVVDDVRIYNRALSQAEITALYNRGAEMKFNKSLRGGEALSNGLVGYWTFDGKDITSGRANDVSGQGNHGNLVNIATSTFYAAGKLGQGFNFDGSDDYVTAGDPASGILDFGTGTSFTTSVWIKTSTTGTTNRILSKGNNGFVDGWVVQLNSSNNSVIAGIGGGLGALWQYYATTNVTDNNWHHIVAVFDQSAKRGRMYIDNVLQALTANGGSVCGSVTGSTDYDYSSCASSASTASAFTIGNNLDGNSEYFNGRIDDARIYNRAFSAAEVAKLYNMGR